MGTGIRSDCLLNFMDKLFEFHCHSNYSKDGGASIENIIGICKKSGVTGIALTDHNEISGALELKKIAPEWLNVIAGEEIETSEGEIIGIFLNEKIMHGMPLEKTISEIKKQGGLTVLPHPFDRLRSKKIPDDNVENYADYFDIIEIFNARNIFKSDNKKARDLARTKNKISICGSDAHFIGEYGRTLVKNINSKCPREFLESLRKADFIERKTSILFHFMTKYKKIYGNNN